MLASFSKKLNQIKKWLNYVLQWNKFHLYNFLDGHEFKIPINNHQLKWRNFIIFNNSNLFLAWRSCILGQLKSTDDTEQDLTADDLEAYGVVLSIGSSRPSKVSVLASEIMSTLPRSMTGALEQWNTDSKNNFPSPGAWVCAF